VLFVYNLPRAFGQTIQEMLSILYHAPGRGVNVWHSLYRETWLDVLPTDVGVVECTAPVAWVERVYPDSNYIIAIRADEDAWLRSCERMYDLAQEEKWTHPIWQLALDQFSYYAREFYGDVFRRAPEGRTMAWVIPESGPDWESLCVFLEMPIPPVPAPWVDWIGGQTGPGGREWVSPSRFSKGGLL
jgi:hypothetical protein